MLKRVSLSQQAPSTWVMLIYKMQDPGGDHGPWICTWSLSGRKSSSSLAGGATGWNSFPSKVFNHLICVKEHQLFISSCASTEDASLLMNPGLETSLCMYGDMKAQGGDKT